MIGRLALPALLVVTAALAQMPSMPTMAQAAPSTTAPLPTTSVTTDTATKTVKVVFVAGHDTANNGLNYNGDAKGEKTLTVPLGWTIEVTLANGGRMPHDFAVVSGASVPSNVGGAKLAFKDAATQVTMPGMVSPTTKFVANRPGSYLILCRVGRHAANGMYVKLVVANSLKEATYR
ncbi:sulfocyanin-like copper-binding protein [Deinococcus yavapaiensis]|uniref:Sulfocyanin SoxE-like protein n=1 Tax=Deinococcus yavapaiensis KR-236 TaxID=694435 RepID=A0A318S2J7_9DEIO|nr:sulfocyanin-like copper-binding protein [Deinococcus yavapaiensis]PYE49966.1 sulfocyanin SoxE-like protein [Deinococcus yavapaiensis KR-236]